MLSYNTFYTAPNSSTGFPGSNLVRVKTILKINPQAEVLGRLYTYREKIWQDFDEFCKKMSTEL